MYTGLLHLHSALRYVVLALLVISIFKALTGWLGKKEFTSADHKVSLFTMIGTHIQLTLGLVLYFISPLVQFGDMSTTMKDTVLRFWTMEHAAMMFLAVVFITIGKRLSKKASNDLGKHKKIAIFFIIAVIIIFMAIPWPFSQVARPWI